MEWTRSGISCNSIRIHVNNYNSVPYDLNRNGMSSIRIETQSGSCKHPLIKDSNFDLRNILSSWSLHIISSCFRITASTSRCLLRMEFNSETIPSYELATLRRDSRIATSSFRPSRLATVIPPEHLQAQLHGSNGDNFPLLTCLSWLLTDSFSNFPSK